MNAVKQLLKQRLPFVVSVARHAEIYSFQFMSMEGIFKRIYRKQRWGTQETASGTGSTLKQTEVIRAELPRLVRELGVKSILDIPCGDFNWMKEVNLEIESYIGADIVKEIIQNNRQRFASTQREFVRLNITRDGLPRVDLILCRDCLVHFSYHDLCLALNMIRKSNSTYLLTTTFTDLQANEDILTGNWRPLNLQKPPFNFSTPIRLIEEKFVEDERYSDKSLGLWRISDILPADKK